MWNYNKTSKRAERRAFTDKLRKDVDKLLHKYEDEDQKQSELDNLIYPYWNVERVVINKEWDYKFGCLVETHDTMRILHTNYWRLKYLGNYHNEDRIRLQRDNFRKIRTHNKLGHTYRYNERDWHYYNEILCVEKIYNRMDYEEYNFYYEWYSIETYSPFYKYKRHLHYEG